MKSSLRTFHTSVAVILLMLLSLFPHHHHEGGAVCVVEEVCALDGMANDSHTNHGTQHQRDSHYCYWQQGSRLLSVQRLLVDYSGNWVFGPHEAIEVPQPLSCQCCEACLGNEASSGRAFLWGKLPVRRGPPENALS